MAKELFGGSDSESQQSSESGFSLLPQQIQDAYTQYATQVGGEFTDDQTSAFTPLSATEGEQSALSSMYEGYSPTSESLSSDIGMLMNPYNEYVIDEINSQAQGEGSVLKQQLDSAGQFGSNRGAIGAGDIDLKREEQIGQFLQDQYNQAQETALTTLPYLQQQSAQSALQAGDFERSLSEQTAQAPFSALSQYGSLLGVLPTTGGSISQGTSDASSTGGLISIF